MDKLSYSCLKDIVEQSRTIVSFLCGKKIPEFSLEGKIDVVADREWVGFPIDWAQPEAYRPLSLRTYNLIVGCNVALFSGWEPDEFTLRLLRRRHGNKHFGVHFNDRRVAGILSNEIEDEVCKQWDQLATLLPLFPAVNFSKRLAAAKSSDWYKNELESRQQSRGDAPIARYAEEDGVRITLAFSALCLHLVASENDKKVRNRLLQIPLSVLLPIVSGRF